MKKLLSAILATVLCFSMAVPAFASEQAEVSAAPANIDFYNITPEDIEKYGVKSVDENGEEIISIRMGVSNDGTYVPAAELPACNEEGVHGGHSIPDGITNTRHFSLTPHTHTMKNIKTVQYNTFEPATEWSGQGSTVTKEYSKGVSINASLNLNGGISKGAVEGELGVTVGGEYTKGTSESYSFVVPKGWQGRIVYYYSCYMYLFDNETTYFWSYTPIVTTTETDACDAMSAPISGYFDLQLKAYS